MEFRWIWMWYNLYIWWSCSNCGCKWSIHKFNISYIIKEQVIKFKKEKTYKTDQKAQQDEKEREKKGKIKQWYKWKKII